MMMKQLFLLVLAILVVQGEAFNVHEPIRAVRGGFLASLKARLAQISHRPAPAASHTNPWHFQKMEQRREATSERRMSIPMKPVPLTRKQSNGVFEHAAPKAQMPMPMKPVALTPEEEDGVFGTHRPQHPRMRPVPLPRSILRRIGELTRVTGPADARLRMHDGGRDHRWPFRRAGKPHEGSDHRWPQHDRRVGEPHGDRHERREHRHEARERRRERREHRMKHREHRRERREHRHHHDGHGGRDDGEDVSEHPQSDIVEVDDVMAPTHGGLTHGGPVNTHNTHKHHHFFWWRYHMTFVGMVAGGVATLVVFAIVLAYCRPRRTVAQKQQRLMQMRGQADPSAYPAAAAQAISMDAAPASVLMTAAPTSYVPVRI